MGLCDVCGKETGGKSDRMKLYAARLKGHSVEQSPAGLLGGEKITTTFERFQPVEVTVCSRHKLELVRTRIMPGIIIFMLLILIVANLMWLIFRTYGGTPIASFVVSAVVTLILTLLALRLIAYDGLIASLLTQRDQPLKMGIIYLTERKYQRMMAKKAVNKKAKQ